MKGYSKILFPAQYLQGRGTVARLPKLISQNGGTALAVVSAPVLPPFSAALADSSTVIEPSKDQCTLAEIDRLTARAQEIGATVIIGAGGGQTVDCCKAVANALSLPVIVCPTTAASDAPCSSVVMVNNEEGKVVKVIIAKHNPNVVLIDLDIVISAPVRHLAAGMGDALSTWYEAVSCQASGSPSVCGGERTMLAMAVAQLSHQVILQEGIQAYQDAQQHQVTEAFSKVIEANILLSGVGFESCGIAAPHGLGNTASVLARTHGMMHGEKVAYGILCSRLLNHAPQEELEELYHFFHAVHLPITLEQLGLDQITDAELDDWVAAACSRHEYVKNEPVETTPDLVRAAILEADRLGRAFLARV